MKKAYLILIIMMLFVILFSSYYVKMQFELGYPETTLVKCFNYSGAKVVNTEIYFWGSVENDKYKSMDKLKELAVSFSKGLGMAGDNELSLEGISNDLIEQVELNGTLGESQLVNITVQQRKDQVQQERFISVRIVEEASSRGLEKVRKDVLTVFEKYKIHARVSSCITGSFDGKLNNEQLNDIAILVFKAADAKKVEGIRDGNLVSVSAYSPIISNYINVNKRRINLNLAIRYNSYENRTYIWLATPVISTEY